jgi:RNA polymerase sigma factor (sigma-70 family)
VNGPIHPVLRHIRRVALLSEADTRTDAHLLRTFVAQRDEAAFEALVRRHGPMVHAVCRRILRDTHDADDALQATFLVLVRKAAAVKNQESLSSWLHGVALRTSLKARAAVAARRKHERRAVAVPAADVDADILWHDLRVVLDEEIQRLPELYRSLVVQCYLEGQSYADAASRLGCSRGTVSTRLTRARALLRKQLLDRGVTLSGAALGLVLAQRATAVSLPLALVIAAIRTATGVAVSARVASLTEGVLKAMSTTRLRITLLFLLMGAFVGVGSGSIPYHLGAAEPAEARRNAPPAEEAGNSRIGEVHVLEGHADAVNWVAFSPAGARAVSASHDRTVRVWDVRTGRELRRLEGHSDRVPCAIFSPNGKRVLSCSWDGTIRLWDADRGKELKRFGAVGAPGLHISRLVYFPDGKRFLSGPLDHHSLQIRDAETGKVLQEIGRVEGHVNAAVLSPDAAQLLEASCDARRPVRLWDVKSGKVLREFADSADKISGLARSPDGKLALSAGETSGPIRLWDVARGREIRQMAGHRRGVLTLAFSPDGRYALSGGMDQSVRLWHVGTGKELCRLFGHLDYIVHVAFSPDGRYALSCSNDTTIRLWRLPK